MKDRQEEKRDRENRENGREAAGQNGRRCHAGGKKQDLTRERGSVRRANTSRGDGGEDETRIAELRSEILCVLTHSRFFPVIRLAATPSSGSVKMSTWVLSGDERMLQQKNVERRRRWHTHAGSRTLSLSSPLRYARATRLVVVCPRRKNNTRRPFPSWGAPSSSNARGRRTRSLPLSHSVSLSLLRSFSPQRGAAKRTKKKKKYQIGTAPTTRVTV